MLASVHRLALLLCAALILVSCGGGTSQIEPFQPTRLITFGDEMSAFEADGRKHAVNAMDAAGTAIDCSLYPLWTQVVAKSYKFGFTECPVGVGAQSALTRAKPLATSAGLKQQIDDQVLAGGFTALDLVTVLVGANDVKELYLRYPAEPEAKLTDEARARGVAIAEQVNRLVGLGAKVIVSTVPDIGLAPYGSAQGAEGAARLSRLSAALNGRIRVHIINDGRFVGLVLADEAVQAAVRSPASYGLVDARNAACKSDFAPPNCTSADLVAGASAETWLWADPMFFAAGGHRQLGASAQARALGNPF